MSRQFAHPQNRVTSGLWHRLIGISVMVLLVCAAAMAFGTVLGTTLTNDTQIAFLSDRHGGTEVYVLSVTRDMTVRATNNWRDEFELHWTTGGDLVVNTRRGGYWRIDRMHTRLSEFEDETQVVKQSVGVGTRRAADGSDTEIYYENADGTLIRLTDNEWDDLFPQLSPDGQWVAYATNADRNLDIYVTRLDGSPPRQLTFNTASDTRPVWSPDSRSLTFISRRDGNAEVYIIDRDGGEPRRVTHHPATDHGASWRP